MEKTINCVLTFDDEGLLTKVNEIPKLSQEQKNEIKDLITEYLDYKSLFIYEGDTRRESYAYPRVRPSGTINGCINSAGKYYLNCGVFAQMSWMGRCTEDFLRDEPIDEINTAFAVCSVIDFRVHADR